MKSKKVGFIGLGRMGRGMSLNILEQHGSLHVFDQNTEAMKHLGDAGALTCESPGEMAELCELIFLCLPCAPHVRTALFGQHGISKASKTGLTIIDTSTLDRSDAITINAECIDRNWRYADCPISGMPFRANDGTLTLMFGGERKIFDELKPLLAYMGTEVRYCGDIGSGQAMKAINNVIYNINIVALCEMLPLATAIGLDPEEVASVVTSASSRSFASEYFVPRMMERRFDTDFAMKDAYKDIINVQRMGVETQAMLPLVNAMTSSYQSAMSAGYADEPKSAILKIYEKILNVEFKGQSENKRDTDDADN